MRDVTMTTATAIVFVIDDDESVRKSLKRLLDAAHYKTEVFQVCFRISLAFSLSGTFVRHC